MIDVESFWSLPVRADESLAAFSTIPNRFAKSRIEAMTHPGSAQTGHRERIETPTGKGILLSGGNALCFPEDDRTCAVGANNEKWLLVDGIEQEVPVVSMHLVKVQIRSKLDLCSESSARWNLIDIDQQEIILQSSFFKGGIDKLHCFRRHACKVCPMMTAVRCF